MDASAAKSAKKTAKSAGSLQKTAKRRRGKPFSKGKDSRRGKGPPKGQGGRRRSEFIERCQNIYDVEDLEQIVIDIANGENSSPADKMRAVQYFADRGFGLPVARHEHTGDEGGPIEVSSPRETLLSELARIAARGDAESAP